ncbi:hypothetical protein BLTE_08330 [Blastochloris tepida]|uniref:Uncharacterized protein n=2 Tax=Blastochloris tepida TaxID=2233851 RepID=A0A348FXW5_9HYPH|nr:hypothetical protein BLTE_08330 [Blastochloris tepida]
MVGRALLIGRRLHPSNQGFGQWCRENSFGDMARSHRADAMWLAENWDAVWAVVTADYNAVAHPTHVRQAYREATKVAAEGEAKPVPFTKEDADYAMKLHRLAEDKCNANESGVARAKLEKLGEDHGMTCEDQAAWT